MLVLWHYSQNKKDKRPSIVKLNSEFTVLGLLFCMRFVGFN